MSLFVRSLAACACATFLVFGLSGCSTETGGVDGADGTTTDGTTTDGAVSDSGGSDTGATTNPSVVVNEVVVKAVPDSQFNPTGSDWIELYNTTDAKVDMTGWRVIDSKSKPFAEAIPLPPGISIPAKGFLVIYFNKDGAGSPTIEKGLGASEAVSLFSADGALQDMADWKDGDAPEGKSWGRTPDGSDITKTFDKPTPNAANP
ncbi:MAG: lamin tail domain-containing protein [Myxococcales bacterium]|nr:lamin tail domain-containing protein [Myxococcales bacterium]